MCKSKKRIAVYPALICSLLLCVAAAGSLLPSTQASFKYDVTNTNTVEATKYSAELTRADGGSLSFTAVESVTEYQMSLVATGDTAVGYCELQVGSDCYYVQTENNTPVGIALVLYPGAGNVDVRIVPHWGEPPEDNVPRLTGDYKVYVGTEAPLEMYMASEEQSLTQPEQGTVSESEPELQLIQDVKGTASEEQG